MTQAKLVVRCFMYTIIFYPIASMEHVRYHTFVYSI